MFRFHPRPCVQQGCSEASCTAMQMGFCAAHFAALCSSINNSSSSSSKFTTLTNPVPALLLETCDAAYSTCLEFSVWAESASVTYACDAQFTRDIEQWGGINPLHPYVGFWVLLQENVHVPLRFASVTQFVLQSFERILVECAGRVLPCIRSSSLSATAELARCHSFAACPAVPPPLNFPMSDLEFLSLLTGLRVTAPSITSVATFQHALGPLLSLLAPLTVDWKYIWKPDVFSHLVTLVSSDGTATVMAAAALRWSVQPDVSGARYVHVYVSLLASSADARGAGHTLLQRLVDHLAPALAACYETDTARISLEAAERPLVRVYKRMQFDQGRRFELISNRPGTLHLALSVPARKEVHFEPRFLQRHKVALLPCLAMPLTLTRTLLQEVFKPLLSAQTLFETAVKAAWDTGPLSSMVERLEAPLAQLGVAFRLFFSTWDTRVAVSDDAWLIRQRALLRAYIVSTSPDPDFT